MLSFCTVPRVLSFSRVWVNLLLWSWTFLLSISFKVLKCRDVWMPNLMSFLLIRRVFKAVIANTLFFMAKTVSTFINTIYFMESVLLLVWYRYRKEYATLEDGAGYMYWFLKGIWWSSLFNDSKKLHNWSAQILVPVYCSQDRVCCHKHRKSLNHSVIFCKSRGSTPRSTIV